MLDIKRIRMELEDIKMAMSKRGDADFGLDRAVELDEGRRDIIQTLEALKMEQNASSMQIPVLKKQGHDVSQLASRLRESSEKIKGLEKQLKDVEEEIRNVLLAIPNIPNEDVPVGDSEQDNVEVVRWSQPRTFEYDPKAHWDIGKDLSILDFETAGKIAGPRFTLYRGLGARLERAVINFFLDVHTREHEYVEMLPPFIANASSMLGTGQLPKFSDDMFKLEGMDYYLVPTAEVPVTNIHADEILEGDSLPISYCAYTPCFRAESSSAGRDTRGLIRQHQFNKVELVKLTRPQDSYSELEILLKDAQDVLQKLELPYRVVKICSADLGFTAAFKYDIEVWMPSYGRYVEISSCSNFEDFQARRAGIRFKNGRGSKVEYVHTINGSGVAVGRTVAAILENFQQEDGSVTVPKALVPYMGGVKTIRGYRVSNTSNEPANMHGRPV